LETDIAGDRDICIKYGDRDSQRKTTKFLRQKYLDLERDMLSRR
jgi:hypothetical protein